MKKYLFIIGVFILDTACNPYKNKQITIDNIQSMWLNIEKDKNLTESQKDFFHNLSLIYQGRDAYKEWLSEQSPNTNPNDFDRVILNQNDFNYVRNQIFTLLESNNLSYSLILSQIQSTDSMNKIYSNQLVTTYREIDSVCLILEKQDTSSLKYDRPKTLYGYCPFMDDNHPLYLKAEEIRINRDNNIKSAFPILIKIRNLQGELIVGF
ncbi:MAG: hypothetical protein J5I91_06290 [Bacteroidetes bacterium]|nr:hypothetical protein [Bacteroidota bacterium]